VVVVFYSIDSRFIGKAVVVLMSSGPRILCDAVESYAASGVRDAVVFVEFKVRGRCAGAFPFWLVEI